MADQVCYACCYENKQFVDYTTTKQGVCDDCGHTTTVHVFTGAVYYRQQSDRDRQDYYAEKTQQQ